MTIDDRINLRYADWLLANAIPNGECLECHMNPNTDRYAKIADNESAHRFVYRVKKGPVTDKVVMHTCDNKRCINLKHLVLGTHAENNQDKMDKGLANITGRPRTLSDEQAAIAVSMRTEGITVQEIANHFMVCRRTIYHVFSRVSDAR